MAPEQIEGKEIDARTDIFAFGSLLYELLTGRKPFVGKSQASLIGAILDHEPASVMSLNPATPPLLEEIVRRSMAKDPDDRWQSMRDVMRQLEWIAAGNGAPLPAVTAPHEPRRMRLRLLRAAAALLVAALIAGGAVAWVMWPTPPTRVVSRLQFNLPEDQYFTRPGRRVVAISNDGTKIVYVANQQLYLRKMEELTATVIRGTEGSDPAEPVFSPDGQSVAFFSSGALNRIPVTGGSAVVLAPAEIPLGTSWENDRILVGQLSPRGIIEIPANGGTPKHLVTVNEKAGEQARSPQLVARGRSVLFTLRPGKAAWDDSSIVVQDLASGERKVLVTGGTDARVLSTGHLVYRNSTTLFAAPFDEARLTVTGDSVAVLDEIAAQLGSGATHVAWSPSGTLVMALGLQSRFRTAPVWVTRQGHQERTAVEMRNYGVGVSEIRLSPDGKRLVASIYRDDVLRFEEDTGNPSEVWRVDIAGGTFSRLSTTSRATSPVWSTDGRRVCYDSEAQVFCQAADGPGPAEPLFKLDGLINTRPFTPDGRMLLETRGAKTGNDIAIATLTPKIDTQPLLNTTFNESAPAISPDGRWLAYESDESGRTEVYVQPFPAVERERWPISIGGGREPRWSRDGRELFFTDRSEWTAPGVLMAVSVQPGSTFIRGKPTAILKIPGGATLAYDVAPDGRFLFHFHPSALDGATNRQEIMVVQNWTEELKQRVPTR
jgi:serine/threonine-protein kinase